MDPEASLTPTIFFILASRARVSGFNIDACSAQEMYTTIIGIGTASAIAFIMLIQSLLGRPVIIGTNHQGSICTGFIGIAWST